MIKMTNKMYNTVSNGKIAKVVTIIKLDNRKDIKNENYNIDG